MAWVTLALRKKELKSDHEMYVRQDLQISREERRMARSYHAEQTRVQNDQSSALRQVRSDYTTKKQGLYDSINAYREEKNNLDPENDAVRIKEIELEISKLQQQIEDAREEYDTEKNETQTYYEDDLEMLENESSDQEAILENQKVEIETLMQSVADELEAVNQSLGQEIKNCTIQLS